jgi:hypothetical protein
MSQPNKRHVLLLSSASIVSRNKWFKCGRGLSFTRGIRNRLGA